MKRRVAIAPKRRLSGLISGLYQSVLRGEGTAFEELREYLPGDDVRFIDWNVTARLRVPHIKVFRHERRLRLGLIIDQSASMSSHVRGVSLFQLALDIAAMLGFAACDHGDEVLIAGTHAGGIFEPTRNFMVIERALKQLPGPIAAGGRATLGRALKRLEKRLTRYTLLILLSDLGLELEMDHNVATLAPFLRRFEWAVCSLNLADRKHLPAGLWGGRDGETGDQSLFYLLNRGVQAPAEMWRQTFVKFGHDVTPFQLGADPALGLVTWLKRRARCGSGMG